MVKTFMEGDFGVGNISYHPCCGVFAYNTTHVIFYSLIITMVSFVNSFIPNDSGLMQMGPTSSHMQVHIL